MLFPNASANLFPTFLTRRKSSSASTASSPSAYSSSPPTSSLARATHPASSHDVQEERRPSVPGSTSRLRCARCLADLALTSQIISKSFNGRWGRAFLVSSRSASVSVRGMTTSMLSLDLPNTYAQRPAARHLVTGLHTVADIGCAICGSLLGWKYLGAEAEEQRYKIGNYILEEKRVVGWGGGEVGDEEVEMGAEIPSRERGGACAVEFDSGDEDECEELFLGTWDAVKVGRRRADRLRRVS